MSAKWQRSLPKKREGFLTFQLVESSRRCPLLHIHALDLCGIAVVDHAALNLQRVGDFAFLHGKWLGQEYKALDFFVSRQILLQCFDVLRQILLHALIVAEFCTGFESDALRCCPVFQHFIVGNNEGRDEFALVGNRYDLIKMTVDGELAFDYLRSDVFAVTRFRSVI